MMMCYNNFKFYKQKIKFLFDTVFFGIIFINRFKFFSCFLKLINDYRILWKVQRLH